MNFGAINRGSQLQLLCSFYAQTLATSTDLKANVIFGPSYKGIPLAVGISSILDQKSPCYFSFNRKEAKKHGEGGNLVGKTITPDDSVVIVEDVVTAGTTLKEIVPLLRSTYKASLKGVLLCVDRQEKIDPHDSCIATQRLEQELELPIRSLITISEILEVLSSENETGMCLSQEELSKAHSYLETYGQGLLKN